MNSIVAESVLVASSPNGDKKDVRVAVGKPYAVDAECWACPIAIEGLHKSLPDIHGVDSWHAMALGFLVVRELLDEFVKDGGTLARGEDDAVFDVLFPQAEEAAVGA